MAYMKHSYKISGKVTVDAYYKGKLVDIKTKNNIVTNNGLKVIRDLLLLKARGPSYIAVGTGTNSPSATDTTLQTEVFRDKIEIAKAQAVETNPLKRTVKYTLRLPENSPSNGNTIAEMGLFNRWKAGDLIARLLLPETIDKTIDIAYDCKWEITIERDTPVLPSLIVDGGLEIIRDAMRNNDVPSLRHFDKKKYLSHIAVGEDDIATVSSMTELVDRITETEDSDSRRKVTIHRRDDSTAGIAKMVIYRYFPENQISGKSIKEAGLFSVYEYNDISQDVPNRAENEKLYSRAPVSPAILNSEKTMVWEVEIKRGT